MKGYWIGSLKSECYVQGVQKMKENADAMQIWRVFVSSHVFEMFFHIDSLAEKFSVDFVGINAKCVSVSSNENA